MKTTFFNHPDIEGNDFPRDSRLSTYALTLLESGQINRHLLEIIVYIFPHGAGQEIAELFGKARSSGHLKEQLAEASDEDDVARAFTNFLTGNARSKSTAQKALNPPTSPPAANALASSSTATRLCPTHWRVRNFI